MKRRPLKHYIYISDTKIQMLQSQMPNLFRKKTTGDLRFSVPLVNFGFEWKSEQNRYSDIRRVVDYIDKHENVGTVDEPGDYIKGTLEMVWGNRWTVGVEHGSSKDLEIVYFSGITEKTVLGLGGSQHHVIGEKGVGGVSSSGSYSAVLVPTLSWILGLPLPNTYDSLTHRLLWSRDILDSVNYTTRRSWGIPQQLEFMAKVLYYCKRRYAKKYCGEKDRAILLGTPIYVAMSDQSGDQ